MNSEYEKSKQCGEVVIVNPGKFPSKVQKRVEEEKREYLFEFSLRKSPVDYKNVVKYIYADSKEEAITSLNDFMEQSKQDGFLSSDFIDYRIKTVCYSHIPLDIIEHCHLCSKVEKKALQERFITYNNLTGLFKQPYKNIPRKPLV